MAKKELRVSEKELALITAKRTRLAELQRAAAQEENGFREVLELVDDRYGVNLLAGEHAITPEGVIKTTDELRAEAAAAQGEPELLTED